MTGRSVKILFLTNLYPPHYIGGYEQLCMDVADGLAERGHECHVLTSTYGVDGATREGRIYRLLQLEGNFHGGRHSFVHSDRLRVRNEAVLAQTILEVEPDLIFVWSMRRLSRSLLFLAEQMHSKVLYYVTDNWLLDQYRPTRRNLRKYLQSYRHLFRRPCLQHVICSSEHMKQEMVQAGIPLERAFVVHNGVDLDPYLKIVRQERQGEIRILYAGRLVAEKGAHTLVEAFTALAANERPQRLHLTMVGAGDADYTSELRAVCDKAGLSGLATFTGNVTRDELPAYFADHDIFVFPSIWQEPFSLTLVMALASAIPVLGTTNGGSKEILVDGRNSLIFRAGDSSDLGTKIGRLIDDADLRKRLGSQGRADSLACTLPAMLDKVETILNQVIDAG